MIIYMLYIYIYIYIYIYFVCLFCCFARLLFSLFCCCLFVSLVFVVSAVSYYCEFCSFVYCYFANLSVSFCLFYHPNKQTSKRNKHNLFVYCWLFCVFKLILLCFHVIIVLVYLLFFLLFWFIWFICYF